MDIVTRQLATEVASADDTVLNSPESGVAGVGCSVAYGATTSSERHAAAAELTARFTREVVPLREPLYRRALFLSRDHADAEDLLQDTMVKAYASFASFQAGTNLHGWLYRIMTNIYISGYRSRRRRPMQCSTEEVTDQQLMAQARRTSTGLRSAEDEALAALPDNGIKAAMQALPEQFRMVVYYADVEGFRYQEIADIMGTPKGTVMSRLARGRRHIRRLLANST